MAPTDTRERVQDLLAKGLTVREVARILDLSTQRIYQIIEVLGIELPSKAGKAAS